MHISRGYVLYAVFSVQALKGHIVWKTLSVTRLMDISQGTSANEMRGKNIA